MPATRATLVLAAMAASAVALPANAAPADALPVATVSYRDLDLRSDAGAAVLGRRIRIALTRVCGGSPRDLSDRARAQTCLDRGMAAARPRMELAVATARGGAQLAQNVAVAPARR